MIYKAGLDERTISALSKGKKLQWQKSQNVAQKSLQRNGNNTYYWYAVF